MSELAAPARRGSITIERGVIEKIARQAASELDGVGRASTGFGFGRGDLAAKPRASVVLNGARAALSLTVGVLFPVPLADTGDLIRQHCAGRVEELTGVVVDRVDVRVGWLGSPEKKEVGPQ